MKKLTAIGIATLACASLMGSCNSSDYDPGETSPTGVAVYTFSLSADTKVMENLDSVFFSIDLASAKIFNADSLPYGASIKRLVPKITMLEPVSVAELIVPKAGGGDTTYNYATNPDDSIDFSNGPVALRVVSANGFVERRYSIKVNVHKLVSDSLVWDQAATRPLPSNLRTPDAQKTTSCGGFIYTLTNKGSEYSLAYATNPFIDDWQTVNANIPKGAHTSSFTAAEKLYVLVGSSNKLYSSSDKGETWSDTGISADYIYGTCNGKIAAAKKDNGTWKAIDIYTGTLKALPAGAPVAETSNAINITAPLATGEQLLVIGGTDAEGKSVKDVWGFDGENWTVISTYSADFICKEMTLVPFLKLETTSGLYVNQYNALLAFGGINDDGTINKTVYASLDMGMSWKKAADMMQIPDAVPARYGAQAFVYSGELHEIQTASAWTSMDLGVKLPSYLVPENAAESRATKPVTEWECPFFYVFGGKDSAGNTYDTVWRATFNRLTFKPII